MMNSGRFSRLCLLLSLGFGCYNAFGGDVHIDFAAAPAVHVEKRNIQSIQNFKNTFRRI
jgi:hypothetical protein